MMTIDNLNVRQMQAYAAICLRLFCNYFGIKHKSIDELINHLITVLIAIDLANWEQKGAQLEITGRGDPLPMSVEETVPQEYLEIFNELVEFSVEVGIVDLYGGTTEQPKDFLNNCLTILRSVGIEPPSEQSLVKYGNGASHWGNAISGPELDEILGAYKI